MIEPAIVVIAYNRPESLRRLLKSISGAYYPSTTITLHISIDASDNSDVQKVAESFEWKFGPKVVDLKNENLGLRNHVLECGQLSEKYDSIIVLEDDLLVAPGFYQYAQQANTFYAKDDKIAGVSLFTYPVEENNFYSFQPIHDDSDVHFIQVASSWGQSWNKHQWSEFKRWLDENGNDKEMDLPPYVRNWGNNSWKKLFINYLIDTDRYFVFPNASYSTNFEDEGTHSSRTGLFQVALKLGESKPRFKSFKDSNSIYDAYFELLAACLKRLNPELDKFDFEVDFYGKKPMESYAPEFVLTSRHGSHVIMSFGANMKPFYQNVVNRIPGNEIGLYRKKDLHPIEGQHFLKLHLSNVELNHSANIQKEYDEQVTVLIPVLENQLEDLTTTIESLALYVFNHVTLLIVCSPSIEQEVLSLVVNLNVNVEVHPSASSSTDELFRQGVKLHASSYCTWIQPGMRIDLAKLECVVRIFKGMSQVYVLHGLESKVEEDGYVRLNMANHRWTPQRAISNPEMVAKVRTEYVFWRNYLIPQSSISKLTTANLLIELMKLTPIYPVAYQIGEMNEIRPLSTVSREEIAKSLQSDQFETKRRIKHLFRPLFHYWFRKNVRFFRLFYRETEQLPMVIRYDFKNDNFYLDNY